MDIRRKPRVKLTMVRPMWYGSVWYHLDKDKIFHDIKQRFGKLSTLTTAPDMIVSVREDTNLFSAVLKQLLLTTLPFLLKYCAMCSDLVHILRIYNAISNNQLHGTTDYGKNQPYQPSTTYIMPFNRKMPVASTHTHKCGILVSSGFSKECFGRGKHRKHNFRV